MRLRRSKVGLQKWEEIAEDSVAEAASLQCRHACGETRRKLLIGTA